MNQIVNNGNADEKIESLKKIASIVYICQVLSFLFAGLPLIIGVIINFYKKPEVQGTWVESHFNWQIITACIALTGFALSALMFMTLPGWILLVTTLMLLVYRIAVGWTSLHANKAVRDGFFKAG